MSEVFEMSNWNCVYNYQSVLVALMVKYASQVVKNVMKLLKCLMVVNFTTQADKVNGWHCIQLSICTCSTNG